MAWRNGAIGSAPGCSLTSVCVSSISKIRSAAAVACCRLAFTRLSFFAGPYMKSSSAMNEKKAPSVIVRDATCRLPMTIAAAMPTPPTTSISGGRLESAAVTFMFVRNRLKPARLNLLGLVRLGAERLHDAMAGERLGADVRQRLERLLAAPRRPPHALAEPDQRIHDERRDSQAHDREPRVVIKEHRHRAADRERLAREVADRLGDHLLHLPHVVVDPRHQLAGRSMREKPADWPRMCL